jgi:hypothetical protein
MQVFQLIKQLQCLDPHAEVHFSYNYGDHWRTKVAPKVGEVFEGLVKYSDYHRTDKLMDENDMYEDEGDFDGTRRVIVIG